MAESVVYQAIFETDTHVVSVSYEPGPEGAIFITSVTLTERPKSQWQEREQNRRKAGGIYRTSVSDSAKPA